MNRRLMDRIIDTIEAIAAIFVGLVAADIFISVLLRRFFSLQIQDYYLREVYKDAGGRITNKTIGKVFTDFQDVHAEKCKMK